MAKEASFSEDPIIALIEELGGLDKVDDFIAHIMSLSDVVKNDMKRALEWDEVVINQKLHSMIKGSLDRNGRYRERPIEAKAHAGEKFSTIYVESQCLLTEWVAVYRTLHVYLYKQKQTQAA
jgi:hypothetical protein